MFRICLKLAGIILAALLVLPLAAQEDGACATGIAPRLEVGKQGRVAVAEGFYLNVRANPGLSDEPFIKLAKGETFDVISGPRCLNQINWWEIQQFSMTGWIAEGSGGDYLVDPFDAASLPTLPPFVPPSFNMTNDLTEMTFAANPTPNLQTAFINWDWVGLIGEDSYYGDIPDPLTLTLPDSYLGDMPEGPFDLNDVRFIQDANLSAQQLAMLAQNGFVVAPAGMDQFEDAYRWDDNWSVDDGHAYWVTTDALLHALHVVFDNMLTFVEQEQLQPRLLEIMRASYVTAQQQLAELSGTALADSARGTAVYYAVALALLDNEAYNALVTDSAVRAEADPLIAAVNSAEGRLPVSFLGNYQEDFSQYIVRGHYTANDDLGRYFRAMSWLGRLTFLAKDDSALVTSLLTLKVLQDSAMYTQWADISEVLTFLIGPTDNLGPTEYLPLAQEIFGADFAPDNLTNPDLIARFREGVQALPGPRINNVVRPVGTEEAELDDATRGFRLFGQRFTLDAYAMQRLIYPYVGGIGNERPLPASLDVAAALGSDIAYALMRDQGDTAYSNYDTNLSGLRDEVNQIDADGWTQSIYGTWLWALQPMWARDPEIYPALMNTQPWLLRDLEAGLGSWTELKHDTLLYTAQPMGGLGGGGERVADTYGMVEPNPLVFSRISLVTAALYQGLEERGMAGTPYNHVDNTPESGLYEVMSAARTLAFLSARMTEMARKELWGEPLTEDEQIFLKYDFGSELWYVRYLAELPLAEPPKVAALVADVASNPDTGEVLQVGTGGVDYIFVIINTPEGLQLNRGTVYSFYEFTGSIDNRMTDEEWRAQVATGEIPPRPVWVWNFTAD